MDRSPWVLLVLVVGAMSGCGRGAAAPSITELSTPGRCTPAGDGSSDRISAPAGRITCHLAVPAEGELVFGLEPPTPPEQFQVIVDQDAEEGPRETVLEAVRTDEEWHVSLRRFAGSVVRVRLVHRRGEALALRHPRVLGAVHRLPALLDSHARSPKHPINVVLYVVDALRADRLSAYGYPYPTSPNLDRLASRGSLFLSAYATGPSTISSVPSLLSSRYPWELGGHLPGWRRRAADPRRAVPSRWVSDGRVSGELLAPRDPLRPGLRSI